MRADHRPLRLKRWHEAGNRWYINRFIKPQTDHLGSNPLILGPRFVKLHGPNIRIGKSVHIIASPDRFVRFTVWAMGDADDPAQTGHIDIGDYALFCPGVRIDSGIRIQVGNNCMLAANAYLSDADWHDIYDRTAPIGNRAPIVLEDNVWIGDSAVVCKGVTIGANSVIGAGSVVTHDIPANVVAAGNPAQVIKPLDANTPLVTRASVLADHAALTQRLEGVERWLMASNTWLGWLGSKLKPNRNQ
jgi:acetyltransferase-like isoleucine patch superfamily enzyme